MLSCTWPAPGAPVAPLLACMQGCIENGPAPPQACCSVTRPNCNDISPWVLHVNLGCMKAKISLQRGATATSERETFQDYPATCTALADQPTWWCQPVGGRGSQGIGAEHASRSEAASTDRLHGWLRWRLGLAWQGAGVWLDMCVALHCRTNPLLLALCRRWSALRGSC